MELLIGCGSTRDKRMGPRLSEDEEPRWTELVTCDIEASHEPDVVWDLRETPWEPFTDGQFSEVHAYEVLEHITGHQGDAEPFFAVFTEIHRILEPDGVLCATVPSLESPWLWADPTHVRAISAGSLVFLQQAEYEKQIGVTAMSDYRSIYKADFRVLLSAVQEETFYFVLQAIKPVVA